MPQSRVNVVRHRGLLVSLGYDGASTVLEGEVQTSGDGAT